MSSSEAYVTLVTNDSYALGALVLAASLRVTSTTRDLVVMVTSHVSEHMRKVLADTYNLVVNVDLVEGGGALEGLGESTELALLGRQDLGVTITKLRCWLLTQYTKCVFMDADTLVIKNIDDLFERGELSASPDAGWPDCFNSGVFVFQPSKETFNNILQFALEHGTFDGGDQGLLNLYFKGWRFNSQLRLPFTYNVVSQAFYSYLPAFVRFRHDIRVVHFVGATKPWHYTYDRDTRQVHNLQTGHDAEYLTLWWQTFIDHIEKKFAPLSCGDAAPPSGPITGWTYVGTPGAAQGVHRQYEWEEGRIDYMGSDSFTNIQQKIDDSLKTGQTSAEGKKQ